MGDESRQITNKLEDTIMSIYNKVGDISISQATIIANGKSMHTDIRKLNGRLATVEEKTDSLESTRDESVGRGKKSATIKKGIAWGLGIMTGVAGLVFGIMRMLQ